MHTYIHTCSAGLKANQIHNLSTLEYIHTYIHTCSAGLKANQIHNLSTLEHEDQEYVHELAESSKVCMYCVRVCVCVCVCVCQII
jgi:hypothetical protein